ncbi:MotE family protein [Antarcticimicrobium sediminis]|uniref:Flagellar motility protein MotE, a chaperone for MotC folding n=1 Tax=Antarcticimicrobium sediminis TaxID=2546227 RepID=A0A4R5EVJ2_9RHOB|nr:hypothetical protein [Antarcticimicrobium sediminis]TDE38901.1 hypothetical protein E1B25_07715 [Antarcticimicrobium sediminis]
MARALGGKLLLGGLALTAFAKAATSFPGLPFPSDEMTRPDQVVQAVAEAAPREPAPRSENTIVRATAPEIAAQCETPEEILQSLARERELIAAQKDDLDSRRSELALAQEKLEIEQAALQELKSDIEDLLSRVKAAQTDDLNQLIGFYENMKPAEAARIMDDLDIEVTILVLAKMKPRVAAPILAKMSPVRARAISKIILERSQLPGDQDLVGIRLK